MWTDGDNSFVNITPKSLQDFTCGSIFPWIWYETDTALLPMFKIHHLLIDIGSCQSSAQALIKFSAAFFEVQFTFNTVIYMYIFLTSSAKILHCMLCASINFAKPSINMINVTGPMPLPCTTPLNKSATEDNEASTRVWCVRPLKKMCQPQQ